jgi:hypothetical protein
MKKAALTLCAALFAVSALAAQTQQAPPAPPAPAAKPDAAAPTVAGNWNISMDYGQGPTDIGAVFKLDGKKVTGALNSQMGEVPLAGEFADGKLTFSIDVNGMSLTFTSTLKDADTMTGTMGGQMGDVPWVAKRIKG